MFPHSGIYESKKLSLMWKTDSTYVKGFSFVCTMKWLILHAFIARSTRYAWAEPMFRHLWMFKSGIFFQFQPRFWRVVSRKSYGKKSKIDRVLFVGFRFLGPPRLRVWRLLPTFRRKKGFGFARGSTVRVGSKFSGRFEVKGLRKNYFYGFIYMYIYKI